MEFNETTNTRNMTKGTMLVSPMETMDYAEARRVVEIAVKRGWATKPAMLIDAYAEDRREGIRMSMQQARSGEKVVCIKHEPNINGRCMRCGRKVHSLRSEPKPVTGTTEEAPA